MTATTAMMTRKDFFNFRLLQIYVQKILSRSLTSAAKVESSFRSGQGSLQPENDAVEEAKLAGHPREAVDEDQAADKKKQRAAEELDGVKMLSEALVEAQELANAECGEQKGHGEAGGVHGEKENAAGDGVAGCCERKHRRENGPDARRPTKSEGEAEEEPAPDPGLRAVGAQANVAVEPARHSRTEETNQRKREDVVIAETSDASTAAKKRNYDQKREHAA